MRDRIYLFFLSYYSRNIHEGIDQGKTPKKDTLEEKKESFFNEFVLRMVTISTN